MTPNGRDKSLLFCTLLNLKSVIETIKQQFKTFILNCELLHKDKALLAKFICFVEKWSSFLGTNR